jgi:CheY-like chemotaxis protein
MRIAIIEDDDSLVQNLSEILKKESWTTDFFKSSSDFGQTDLSLYDVIISDLTIKPIDGRELLTTLSRKTTAELLLMSDGTFDEVDLRNEAIRGLIDKTNLMNVVDKLNYLDTKIRIQKLASEEHQSLENIYTNGTYTIENIDKASLLDIKEINNDSLAKIKQYLNLTDKNIIMTFSDLDSITSSHLGLIAGFYNVLKERKKKLIYWNKKQSKHIEEVFKTCQLIKIVPFFNEFEMAVITASGLREIKA